MKKLFCMLLSGLMLVSFAACSPKKTSSGGESVDLEYFASLGKLPEGEYSLGDSVEKLKNELSAAAEESGSEAVYDVIEGEENVLIDAGSALYYYKKADPEKGIAYIVSFEKAFGFELGTLTIEVKDALSDYTCTEEDATEDTLFFLLGAAGTTVMKYKIKNRVILFVFQDHALYATALYDAGLWS